MTRFDGAPSNAAVLANVARRSLGSHVETIIARTIIVNVHIGLWCLVFVGLLVWKLRVDVVGFALYHFALVGRRFS